jgi:hypothetical protein
MNERCFATEAHSIFFWEAFCRSRPRQRSHSRTHTQLSLHPPTSIKMACIASSFAGSVAALKATKVQVSARALATLLTKKKQIPFFPGGFGFFVSISKPLYVRRFLARRRYRDARRDWTRNLLVTGIVCFRARASRSLARPATPIASFCSFGEIGENILSRIAFWQFPGSSSSNSETRRLTSPLSPLRPTVQDHLHRGQG